MALDRTAGFDMLVQVSEAEVNDQLATAFLAGATFSPALSAFPSTPAALPERWT